MAANYGRLTGKTGVALATLGPGATNMMTGVAYAQLGGMPLLVITGQKPIRHSKQGKFQVIDVVAMMKPITKYAASIVDGVRIPSMIAHALATAEEERPGAVHLELAEDIAGFLVDDSAKPIIHEKIRRAVPDEKSLKNLIHVLENSKRPMILVGAGANRKRISKYLTQFIEKYNIPFFTSQMGKGVVDERLPQYIGTAALTSGDYLHEAIDQADLILAIGHDTIEKPTNIIESFLPDKGGAEGGGFQIPPTPLSQGGTKLVHINFFPAEFDSLYQPDLQIIGDIGNTMRQLCEATIDSSQRDFEQIFTLAKKAKEKVYAPVISKDIMGPQQLIADIRSTMGAEDIVTLDNGLYKVWFARNYPCYDPNTLLLDNALATMGAGYSTGMMAKILYPSSQVVTVTGDGGLVMNLGDLETAVRLGIDLTIIVLNDNAYGMIKRKQKAHGYQDF